MSIYKKIIFGCLITAVVFTGIYFSALYTLPKVVDLNKYKEKLTTQIEQETGFKVSCENMEFRHSFSPYLKIYMYHTLVLYPDEEVFLKLKETELKIKIIPLIFKKVVIKNAKLTRPIINVTLYKDFSTSLEKYINPDKTFNAGGFNLNAVVSDTLCENYKLKIYDESINRTFYLEGPNLIVKNLKLNDSAHILLKGALLENEKEYIKYDIDVLSDLSSEKSKFTFSPFKSIYESDVRASVSGILKLDKNNINGNLKINDLSLKADNVYLKDNNINLIFKGEEAEINSVLHTSLKDKVEIDGRFAYGKKRYIDLHTKAANTNLTNLTKITSEITKILNIDNPLKDINLKGILDADFSVNSDFKKLKSKGSAKIKNAIVISEKLPYKITGINADINFNDNKIQIENAGLKVNYTPIKITGLINPDVTADIKAQSENLDLKAVTAMFIKDKELPVNILKGKLSFESDIKGNLNKSVNTQTKAKLSQVVFVEKTQKLPVSISQADININTNKDKYFGDITCFASTKYKKTNINLKDLKFTFDDKEIKLPQNIVYVNNSQINVSGDIKNYLTNAEVNMNYAGKINSNDLGIILSEYIKEPYKAIGALTLDGTCHIKDKISKVKTKIKADKDNYISYLVIKELLNKPSVLNVDAEINQENIILKDLSLYENIQNAPKIIALAGQIINSKAIKLKDLRVQIPNTLSINTNFFGGEEISLNADIILNNTVDKPQITGNAKIYKYNIKKLLTSMKNMEIIFSPNNIKINAPDVQVNGSAFNISAILNPVIDFKNIVIDNMEVNSLNLDLNSLFYLQNMPHKIMVTIKKGSVAINNFQVLDIKAKDIVSDFVVENNKIKLSNITANAYAGQVNGKVDYNFNYGNIDIDMTGQGLDVKSSLYDLCKIEDNLAGRANFKAQLSMRTGTYNEVLKSIKGKLQYGAQNGKMGTLGKFEYYLYAQNLLSRGILNATLNSLANTLHRDNTSYFKESSGNITFENGYMIADEITTTGTNMSLFMQGRHNMLTNQANIEIYGRISDEIKNKLGSFGNVSLADVVNTKQDKKNTIISVPNEIIDKIPQLYKKSDEKTNNFKVNIYGDINSLNAINSFMWVVPKAITEQTENIPDKKNSEL